MHETNIIAQISTGINPFQHCISHGLNILQLWKRNRSIRVIWEMECKASQVFTELWSSMAENNSMDQCFSKYGLENYIRIMRFCTSPQSDFLAPSKRFKGSGWVPEICIFRKHLFFFSLIDFSHIVVVWNSMPSGEVHSQWGKWALENSLHETDEGLGQLYCTKRFPKEPSAFTLAVNGPNGKDW